MEAMLPPDAEEDFKVALLAPCTNEVCCVDRDVLFGWYVVLIGVVDPADLEGVVTKAEVFRATVADTGFGWKVDLFDDADVDLDGCVATLTGLRVAGAVKVFG